MFRICVACLLLLPIGGLATAQQAAAPRISARIADAEWQILPADVYDVHIGPDGRTWFASLLPWEPLDRKMQRWAAEYSKPDPQEHWFPVLFEPGGRVWFSAFADSPQQHIVLGYDGKEWIKHELPHGNIADALYAADHAFFACGNQIHTYDGKQWSVHELWKVPANKMVAYPDITLVAEPGGRGVVARAPAGDAILLRWHDAKWTPIKLPLEALAGFTFQPDQDGIWLITDNFRLIFVAYDGDGLASLAPLLRDLASDDQAVRDEATRRLVADGPRLGRALELQRGTPVVSSDPQLLARLNAVLAETYKQPSKTVTNAPGAFGPATIADARIIAAGPERRMFAGGSKTAISGYSGPAVVMRDPEGDYLTARGDDVLRRWTNLAAPVSTPHGDAIWLPGDGDRAGIALFNLRSGRLTHYCPDPRMFVPIGGTSDGVLYAKAQSMVAQGLWALVRYAPGRPRKHVEFDAQKQWAVPFDSVVEANGNVASFSTTLGLQRSRDGRVINAPDIGDTRTRHMMAGRNGGLLLWTDNRDQWTLVVGDKVSSAPTLKDLITSDPVIFAQTFVEYTSRIAQLNHHPAFAADRAGRIWLAEPQQDAQVLVNGQWRSIADELQAAGIGRGQLAYASPVGDGSAVYLSNVGSSDRRVGILASFDGDKLVLRKTVALIWTAQQRLRTPDGTLWIYGVDPSDDRQRPRQCAFPLTEKGAGAALDDCIPVGQDRQGNTFFTKDNFVGSHRKLAISRNGRIVSTLDIPALSNDVIVCGVDETRTLVWTGTYLQELVQEHPGEYRLGRLIIAKFGYGTPESLTLSDPGRLLAMVMVNKYGIQRRCMTFDLASLFANAPATDPAPQSPPVAATQP